MTAQVLFLNVFSEKDPHLNAIEKFVLVNNVLNENGNIKEEIKNLKT